MNYSWIDWCWWHSHPPPNISVNPWIIHLYTSSSVSAGPTWDMWEVEIRGMASAHALLAGSVLMGSLMPALTVENFSVYGTHLVWLYSVSGCVAVLNVAVFWLLGLNPPTKKNTMSHKVWMFTSKTFKRKTDLCALMSCWSALSHSCFLFQLSRMIRSCVYFLLSCLFFHGVVVLYGAPLLEWVLPQIAHNARGHLTITPKCACWTQV